MSLQVELDNRNAELAVADAEEARLTRELSEVRAWRSKVVAQKAALVSKLNPTASQAPAPGGSIEIGAPEPQ
jgi:hypothetical protein